MPPPKPSAPSYHFTLVFGAILVLVAAWVLWSLLLSPPAPTTTAPSLSPTARSSPSALDPAKPVANTPTSGASPTVRSVPTPKALPRPARGQISANELKAALVGDGAVPGEALLTFRTPEELAAFRTRASLYGLKILDSDARLRTARVGWSDLDRLADELNEHPSAYENVAANLIARIPGLPREPVLDASNQGGSAPFEQNLFASIGADTDRSGWGASVKVAVLDSGIADHETLSGLTIDRVKLVEAGPVPNGHGTSMASLISGRVAPAEGVAPSAKLIDIWVADEQGMSNTALVAAGIMEAVDRGAQVINISLGSFGSSLMLQNAVQYALDNNVLIIAAAGNEQLTQLAYPAAYPGVISVGAVDANQKQAYFSNSGSPTLAAPGVGILSAYTDGKIVVGSGTSQATAITTGVVATLLGRGLHPKDIPGILTQNALNTGAPKEQVGAGMLQMP